MSVQLIVYPQNYQGQHNVVSLSPTEMCVNGINFTGLSSTPSYDVNTVNVASDIMANAYPSIPNSWYRYRTITTGTPSLPTNVSGTAVFYSVTTGTLSGIYQRMTNLVIGSSYTITIQMANQGTGSMVLSVLNNDGTLNSTYSGPATGINQISTTFIAKLAVFSYVAFPRVSGGSCNPPAAGCIILSIKLLLLPIVGCNVIDSIVSE